MKDFTGYVWANSWPFCGRGHLEGEPVPQKILDAYKPRLIAEGRIKKASEYIAKKAKEA